VPVSPVNVVLSVKGEVTIVKEVPRAALNSTA